MQNNGAVDDYIAEQEYPIPRQAMNSARYGTYSYWSRRVENKAISSDSERVQAVVVADAYENGAIAQIQRQPISLQTASEILAGICKATRSNYVLSK